MSNQCECSTTTWLTWNERARAHLVTDRFACCTIYDAIIVICSQSYRCRRRNARRYKITPINYDWLWLNWQVSSYPILPLLRRLKVGGLNLQGMNFQPNSCVHLTTVLFIFEPNCSCASGSVIFAGWWRQRSSELRCDEKAHAFASVCSRREFVRKFVVVGDDWQWLVVPPAIALDHSVRCLCQIRKYEAIDQWNWEEPVEHIAFAAYAQNFQKKKKTVAFYHFNWNWNAPINRIESYLPNTRLCWLYDFFNCEYGHGV